jgi:hypothetical protein
MCEYSPICGAASQFQPFLAHLVALPTLLILQNFMSIGGGFLFDGPEKLHFPIGKWSRP